MRLALSGNIFIDSIIEINQLILGSNYNIIPKIQLGGIANVSRALSKLEIEHDLFSMIDSLGRHLLLTDLTLNSHAKLKLEIAEENLDEATIIVERYANRRTSFVKNGSSEKAKINTDFLSEFHHISYLDNLKFLEPLDLKKMKKNGVRVSADLCKNFVSKAFKVRVLSLITEIDLLIISGQEFVTYLGVEPSQDSMEVILRIVPNVIVHLEDGCWVGSRGSVFWIQGRRLSNVDVLGAGDKFVAYFYSSLLNGSSILESAEFANISTTNELEFNS